MRIILIALIFCLSACTKKKEVDVVKKDSNVEILILPTLEELEKESKELEAPKLEAPKSEVTAATSSKMKANGSWQIVYNGKYTDYGKDYVILDLFEFSEETIKQCKYPIAYFSAHYEDWRPDKNQFGKKLGKIGGWKGEYYVEWTDPKNQKVMLNRLDLAVSKGFKGVDIDNVDGPKTSSYVAWLLKEAKKRGLSFGLKNSVEVLGEFGGKVDFFVSEASSLSELTCYEKYKKPVVRMYYGKGAKTPSYIYQVRSGSFGNKF